MSIEGGNRKFPRSIRHKQVLDTAQDMPDASLEEIAAAVPSATPEMVERVLDEYGDPAVSDSEAENDGRISENSGAMTAENGTKTDEVDATADDRSEDGEGEPGSDTEHDSYPSPEDLSEKQREVLAAVAARPEATQAEIGEQLGVTSATVSNRANSIEGFEWYDRKSFVEAVFEDPPSLDAPAPEDPSTDGGSDDSAPDGDSSPDGSTGDDALEDCVSDLRESVDELRAHITDLETAPDRRGSEDASPFEDPELVHKVVHACLDSEAITEAEELRILEAVLE